MRSFSPSKLRPAGCGWPCFLQSMPLTDNPSSSWKVLTVTFVCGSARLGFCLVAAWPGLPGICWGSILLSSHYKSFLDFFTSLTDGVWADGLAFSALLSLFSSLSLLSAGSGHSCYGDCGTGSSLLMCSLASFL